MILSLLFTLAAFAQESHVGNLASVMKSIHEENGFPLDYFHKGSLSAEQWRKRGRDEVSLRLSYSPKAVPLDLKVHQRIDRDGHELRVISFAGSPHYRIPAYLLVPKSGKGPFPGVVGLHDHGGYFVHGKEKIVSQDKENPALTDFKKQYYGGRNWADEFVRRGFVVLVIDAFYWGERTLQYQTPPDDLKAALRNYTPDQPQYVRAMNTYIGNKRHDLNSTLRLVGATWLGIMNYDDRRSVDLLASLPEVDVKRLGCMGLSIGGYRSVYLNGMDSRIKAAVVTGWMTSMPTHLDIAYSVVAGLPDADGLHAKLDHPDVASLNAPNSALFVQNCAQDRLFTRAGMDMASEKIQRIYKALGKPEKYRMKFYDNPHQFNLEMQEDAFQWMDRWLK